MPPDRNTPTGTSATRCARTLSRTASPTRSRSSASPARPRPSPGTDSRMSANRPFAATRRRDPAAPRAGREALDAVEPGQRRRHAAPMTDTPASPAGDTARSTSPARRSAPTSDANATRPARRGDVQRLDAEPVARQQQRPLGVVPQREREHAAQRARAPSGHRRTSRRSSTSVSLSRREPLALALELGAQLAVVVDLAVEDEPIAAVAASPSAGRPPSLRSMIASRRCTSAARPSREA